jgi:hypothetical protein
MSHEREGRSEQDYQMNFQVIGSVYRMLKSVPLDDMLKTIDRADSIGPILDPTSYARGMHRLPPQRRIIEAAMKFRNEMDRLIESLPNEVRS